MAYIWDFICCIFLNFLNAWYVYLIAVFVFCLLGKLFSGALRTGGKQFSKFLTILAISVFVLNIAAEMYVQYNIVQGYHDLVTSLSLAILHSVGIFFLQTHFFDNGYHEFFFGTADGTLGHPVILAVFVILFLLALCTSAALVIRVFLQRRRGLAWLEKNKDSQAEIHIFFGRNERSLELAGDIKSNGGTTVLVEDSEVEEKVLNLSIWEKIKMIYRGFRKDETGAFEVIIYLDNKCLTATEGGITNQEVSLGGLELFLNNRKNSVYLLEEDERKNLMIADTLTKNGCSAKIYCMARKEGANQSYGDTMSTRSESSVTIIDSSSLAVNDLRMRDELQPVNFIEKGRNKDGDIEGWTDSSFNAMIVGFGEMGRDVLGFLFEQAAFVTKDYRRSPFSCWAIDSKMDEIEGRYKAFFPEMKGSAGIRYAKADIGSIEFWDIIRSRINTLNYMVICLGDDTLNLSLGIDILNYANKELYDADRKFAVLIAQKSPTALNKTTIDSYNRIGKYKIYYFGDHASVWKHANVTGKNLENKARSFFAGYKRAEGQDVDANRLWEDREKKLLHTTDYGTLCNLLRQRAQDYANCFHIYTKMALMHPYILEHADEIAKDIPATITDCAADEDAHYLGDKDFVRKNLKYLAVLEHIRWEASHTAMGYVAGERTDAVRKTHKCIRDYSDLPIQTQHYDYLVVKTTLDMTHEEN